MGRGMEVLGDGVLGCCGAWGDGHVGVLGVLGC